MEKHLITPSIIFVIGLMIGACAGLYFAARVFPLSTSETIYLRSQ